MRLQVASRPGSRRSVTSASQANGPSRRRPVQGLSQDARGKITALAVQCMSSRAIGDLLHIGERTVESHLARVYLKFGVHSRQQLTHAIAMHAR